MAVPAGGVDVAGEDDADDEVLEPPHALVATATRTATGTSQGTARVRARMIPPTGAATGRPPRACGSQTSWRFARPLATGGLVGDLAAPPLYAEPVGRLAFPHAPRSSRAGRRRRRDGRPRGRARGGGIVSPRRSPRRRVGVAAGPLGLASVAYWGPGAFALLPGLGRRCGVLSRLEAPAGVALTFDDGPHAEGTPAVLEILRRAGAPATFFLVGEQVERRPALAAEIAAAGHEIAVHCHRHRNLMRLSPRAVRDDLARAVDAIGRATGLPPRLYRPPHGILTTPALLEARRRGWIPVLWSRDGRDWSARASAASIAARLTGRLRAGDILLLHDADDYSAPGSWRRTVAALPAVLAHLERRALSALPGAALL